MERFMRLIFIGFLSVFFITGCQSDDKVSDLISEPIPFSLFSQKINQLTGENSTSCGHVALSASQQETTTCVIDNYSLKQSFSASFSYQENDKSLAMGIVYKADAQLHLLYFDVNAVNNDSAIEVKVCESAELIGDVKTNFRELFSCNRVDLIHIAKGQLLPLDTALKHQDKEFVALIDRVRGSVGKSGVSGSKVVWSRKNKYALGLYLSANHVRGIDTWGSRTEGFVDLSSINNGIYLGSHLPHHNGSLELEQQYIADYHFYQPSVPQDATNTSVWPADDFVLGIVDNQHEPKSDYGLSIYPAGLVDISTPLQMYDPKSRTLSAKTWNDPVAGEVVMAVGYPQDSDTFPLGAVSVGKVYSDTEAEQVILALKEQGDEEGGIAYDNKVEFLMTAKSAGGMSGGGVFNDKGQLLGVLVRGTMLGETPITRVVKISYIREKIKTFAEQLNEYDSRVFSTFVGEELN